MARWKNFKAFPGSLRCEMGGTRVTLFRCSPTPRLRISSGWVDHSDIFLKAEHSDKFLKASPGSGLKRAATPGVGD